MALLLHTYAYVNIILRLLKILHFAEMEPIVSVETGEAHVLIMVVSRDGYDNMKYKQLIK